MAGPAPTDLVRRAWLRLGGLSAALVVVGLITLLVIPFSRAGIAATVEPFGPAAPVAFVVAGGLLGMAFVPGPLLAAVSGVLFGSTTGFVVTTCSAVVSATLSTLVSRRAGRGPVEAVSGERAAALISLARRRGFLVVVLQRWMPGLPDAVFSYLFGAIGLRVVVVAAGTLVGSAPRAFAYTALGDAAVTGNGSLALIAVATGGAVSVLGLLAGVLVVRRERHRSRNGTADSDRITDVT
ncbi:MAG: VTT domain-containing protein [Nocardioides sp.]